MSRGRRYSGEGKLNIKKVVAVLIALALIVIVVISIAKLFGGNKVESKVVTTEYFAAYSEGKWGVIDSKGKEIVKPSYDEAIIIPNSKEAVFICTYDVNYSTNEYKTKAVNEKGEQLFTEYDGIRAIENYDVNNNLWYEDDVLIVTKNGKYGLIDFKGKVLANCDYDSIAALKGVYDGSYYAAIIIGDDFSRSLFDFLDTGMKHPSVTYYENSKKNAVATKITDTASSTLQQTINTEFINVAAQTALSGLESITQKDSSISDKLIDDMKTIQDNLSGYADTIATFQNGNASLSENLESMSALIPELQDILENSKDTTKLTQSALSRSVDNMTDQLDTTLAAMETISEQVQKQLDTAQNKITSDTQGASDALSAALDSLNSLLEQNHKLDDLLNKLDDLEYIDHNIIAQIRGQLEAIATLQDLAKNLIDQTSSIVKETPEIAAAKAEVLHSLLSSCLDKMTQTQQKYHTIASSGLSSLKITVNAAADSAYKSLENSGSQLNSLEQILLGTSKIALTANQTLGDTGTIISGMSDKIQLILTSLNNITDSSAYQTLSQLLHADAVSYAEFIATPVEVEQIDVYPAVNYGTAVTPFYTALALWVGGIVLVALMKVHVDNNPKMELMAKPHELYLGRFLLFFVMGQIQSLIIVLGDLYLLKVSCEHPGLLILTASVASFVFVLLIYTLTLSFGDVGKTIAVVMVVIQIAGSSGTFPIELLPQFFQNVYLYFPFPYAINAMREAISGMYEMDYFIYMGKLLIFAAASLLLGLVIRKPFIPLNHFFEEKMKETKMM